MYICVLYTQHIILILSTYGFSLCISNVACSFEISSPAKKLKIQTYHPSGSNDLSPDAYAIFPERAGAQWLLCCPMCPRGMCTSQWQPHPYIESPRMSRLLRHAQLVCDRFRFLEGHWKKGSGNHCHVKPPRLQGGPTASPCNSNQTLPALHWTRN